MAEIETQDAPVTGGCLCGAVRYVAASPPDQVLVCHCPDCRRAVGAHAVAWLFVAADDFRFTSGDPATYVSSEGVQRRFCTRCGTSLTWEGRTQPGRIDIAVGSLDDPERFPPTRAVYRRHRLAWASEI